MTGDVHDNVTQSMSVVDVASFALVLDDDFGLNFALDFPLYVLTCVPVPLLEFVCLLK